MKPLKVKTVLAGMLIAVVFSTPLSWLFVANTSFQDLERIDQTLGRYFEQIKSQTGSELDTAQLVAQLAGEQLSISLKTIDNELVEIGTPSNSIPSLPSEEMLGRAQYEPLSIHIAVGDDYRIRTIALADDEYIILGVSLREHNQLVASSNLIAYLVVLASLVLGAIVSLLTGKVQESRMKIALMQAQLEMQRRGQESMSVFLGDVAHELKSPLTVIRGYSEILLKQSKGDTKSLDRILSESRKIENLLAELSRMAELRELASQTPEDVDFAAVIERHIADLGALQRDRSITVAISDRPIVLAPSLLIELLVSNIFSNIRKHTASDAPVIVDLLVVDGELELNVDDGGTGLTEEVLENMKARNNRYSTVRNTSVEGQGLGIAIIQDTVKQIGGEVSFNQSSILSGLSIQVRMRTKAISE